MIVDLVKSWLDGDLVPALILWHSRQSGKVFIVDGAHRLSALIGWVNDDYGDGPISRAFFDEIPPAQIQFHKQTQTLMAQKVGSYNELHRMAMKPLATLNKPTLGTVDTVTKESTVSFKERTDVTAVPAMGVVAETMVALVLAAEAQRKFGGDSVDEFVRNAQAFNATL